MTKKPWEIAIISVAIVLWVVLFYMSWPIAILCAIALQFMGQSDDRTEKGD